jgi:hypothetical protein
VTQRALPAPAIVVASARTRDGLALLLGSPAGLDGARLLLIGAAGTRTIPLPTLQAPPRPLDKSSTGSAIGLAIDHENLRAYMVEQEGRVMVVDLSSGKVTMRALPLRQPARAAKGISATAVQAIWLGQGLLALTGVRRVPSGRLAPMGLRLLDTRSWRTRLLEADATGMAHVGATLLAYQPQFDQLGPKAHAIGLRGYRVDGSIRFRAFSGQPITVVGSHAGYAYAGGLGPGGIVDVPNGRVELPHPDAVSISTRELLAGPGL